MVGGINPCAPGEPPRVLGERLPLPERKREALISGILGVFGSLVVNQNP
jgi:hypothetical protein